MQMVHSGRAFYESSIPKFWNNAGGTDRKYLSTNSEYFRK
ncbi:hypothetical protein X975_16252, partial [Stegodyphus mimosarum]